MNDIFNRLFGNYPISPSKGASTLELLETMRHNAEIIKKREEEQKRRKDSE